PATMPSSSTCPPWRASPRPPPPGWSKVPCNACCNGRPTPWRASNLARPVADSARSPTRAVPSTSAVGWPCPTPSRAATVPTAAGTFPPLRPRLRLDGHGYSPAVLEQVVTAAARLDSFADAAFAVGLTGLSISPRHVQQLTGEAGADL